METAIQVKNLSVDYILNKEESVRALRDIDMEIKRGETVAIVGESGCGKSTLASALMRLLPENTAVKGEVKILGENIMEKSPAELRKIRGVSAGIIFQEPAASLNPVFTVKQQIEETIKAHYKGINKKELAAEGIKLLKETGIGEPERVYNAYPHRLSGGQQQRVMLSIALSCDPDILIADEPTTALDVTVQARIIERLKKLKQERGLTLALITHDLHLAHELAERVIVMYAGEIAEDGIIKSAKDAAHPYTEALFEIIPDIKGKKRDFKVIPGAVPDLREIRDECAFAGRCRYEKEQCRKARPAITEGRGRRVRCYYPGKKL